MSQWEDLDNDVLYYILMSVPAKDVLSLCRVNTRYKNLCRDPSIFKNLMQKHYPHLPLNRDIKQQFIDITQNKQTHYYAVFNNMYDRIDHFNVGFSTGTPSLVTPGRLDSGTQVWVVCWLAIEETGIMGNCTAFSKKEDALEFAVKDYLKNARDLIRDEIDVAMTLITEEEAIRELDITLDLVKLKKGMLNPIISEELPHYLYKDNLQGIDHFVYYQVFPTQLP